MVIELQCVKKIDPIHEARILAHRKRSGIRTGLMFNGTVTKLKVGRKR